MSSVVTKPEALGSEPAPAGGAARRPGLRVDTDLAAAALLAAALVAISFLTKSTFGGASLGANTWIQIALVAAGAAAFGAVALLGAPGRFHGLAPLALFGALAALTYASIGWSVQPSDSWLEANRTLSYLAAFGGAVALARLVPKRWPALIGGVAIAAVALSGWALLAKVFPGSLDAGDTLGRLNAPLGYWNAVGLIAALGLAPVLWAGARPRAPRAIRAIAVPAITVLISTLVLSYGRGALAAAVIGVALWLALVPFRLRAVPALLAGGAGAAVVIGWGLKSHSLTSDNVALSARTSDGHSFGVVLLVVLLVVAAAGYALALAGERVRLGAVARRRSELAMLAVAALIPVAGVVALAASSRGLTGEVSHVWGQLTSSSAHLTDTSNRLLQVGSSRPIYWHEGLEVGGHHLLAGAGAGGFGTVSLRYDKNKWAIAAQAHSYVIQTFADLGLVGLLVSLALLSAWGLAAARTAGLRGPRAGPAHDRERAGIATLFVVVVIFGIHSLVDWTWFVPGVTLPALLCAGWIAGRGPLSATAGRLARARRVGDAPGVYAAVTVGVAALLGCAWFIWQPLRSSDADAAAIAASIQGNTRTAFADARAAHSENPESTDPLFELSLLYSQIGDRARARLELVDAVSLQPQNPDTWTQLGEYDLDSLHRRRAALGELQRAYALDPAATSIQIDLARAEAAR